MSFKHLLLATLVQIAFSGMASCFAAPLDDLEPFALPSAGTSESSVDTSDLLLGSDVRPDTDTPSREHPLEAAAKLFAQRKIEACLEQLKAAKSLSPNMPTPHVLLAEFYLQVGNFSGAQQALQAEQQVEKHPQFYYTSGKLAFAQRRYDEAEEHFTSLAALVPPASWTAEQRNDIRAASHSGLASVAERRKQWDLAVPHIGGLVKLDPSDNAARWRLGKALLLSGQEEQARQQFELLHQADNKNGQPEVAIAEIYMQNGQIDRADETIKVALFDFPDDAPLRFAAAMSSLYRDNFADADQHAKFVEAEGLKTVKLFLLRSQIAWGLGEYERAAAHAAKALEQSPEHAVARYCYVAAFAAQGDQKKRQTALRLAEAFLRENPRSPAAMAAVGTALFQLGQHSKAERFFRPVVNHPSMPAEPQFYYGVTLAKNGKTKEARVIAQLVRARISQPGIFLTRAAAKTWTGKILEAE